MKKNSRNIVLEYWEFAVFSALIALLVILCVNHIFFWDTVQLASKHGTFYFNNNLSLELLPDEIDSGHIPSFGYLLAALWKLFGKSLLVSHLYVLPFALGIVWQLDKLIKRFFSKKHLFWVMLIVLIDTTFLSQVSLVSPDVPLLFFFLYGLNSILSSNRIGIAIAFFCLFLVSMRGMILTVPLFLFDVYLNVKWTKESIKYRLISFLKICLSYVPSTLLFISFSWFHFSQKGWIGYHESSPWAAFFQVVDFNGAVKNAGIFGWRLLDFGRIAVWFTCFISLLWIWLGKNKLDKNGKLLFALTLLIIGFLSIPAIIYTDLKGHRYFMPIYFSFSVFTCYLLFEILPARWYKKIMGTLMILVLLSGSFWVYPKQIAQGWDSTLAHLPYYKLRSKMLNFIDNQGISKEIIGYDFPGAYPQYFLDLSKETWCFPEADFSKHEFILFSSVVNEFTDDELLELEENWIPIHSETSITVDFILYQNPYYQ